MLYLYFLLVIWHTDSHQHQYLLRQNAFKRNKNQFSTMSSTAYNDTKWIAWQWLRRKCLVRLGRKFFFSSNIFKLELNPHIIRKQLLLLTNQLIGNVIEMRVQWNWNDLFGFLPRICWREMVLVNNLINVLSSWEDTQNAEFLHGESSRVRNVDNFPDIKLCCLFDWKQTYAIQNRPCHRIRMRQQHLRKLHSKLKRQISTSSLFYSRQIRRND